MKIEVQEKFIKVTPEEGKLLYSKVKPNSLMKEISAELLRWALHCLEPEVRFPTPLLTLSNNQRGP